MSNYPPPPQWGATYSQNGFMAPPAGTYAGASQHPYQPPNQALYVHGQGQSNGVSPAPNANAYSFNVNAQGVTPPGNSVNRNSSGYGNQGYPPAPHPPHVPTYPPGSVPFGTSYFPQPSTQASPNLTSSSNQQSFAAEPFTSQPVVKDQDTYVVKGPNDIVQATSDLEDGEVDDEDEGEKKHMSVALPEVDEMGLGFSRSSQTQNKNDNPAVRAHPNGDSSSTHEPSSGLPQDSRSELGGQLSISSPSQQPHLPNGLINTSVATPLTRLSEDNLKVYPAGNGDIGGVAPTDVQLAAKKREEGRQALMDLLSHGLDFDQIVSQGIDPDLLRILYAENGIPVTFSSPSKQTTGPQVIGQDVSMVTAPKVASVDGKDQSRAPQLTALTHDNSLLQSKATGNLNSRLPVTVAKDENKSVFGPTTEIKKSLSTNTLAKPAGTKTADQKPVDRAEYIARMLAAKTGKPVVSSTASVPKVSTMIAPAITNQVPTSSAKPITKMPTTKPVPQIDDQPAQVEQSIVLPHPLKDDSDVEAKRKAKTDLARQKIEALRLQQESRTVSRIETIHQDAAASLGTAPQAPVVAPVIVPRPSAPSRQSSYFSPISQKAPFSIPGLFMASDTSNSVQPANQGFGQSSIAPAAGLQQRPITTAAGLTLTATTTFTPRKRQKAADFLDPPPMRVKRPLGQQEDSSVIIDISDDEMTDASDADSLDVESTSSKKNLSKDTRTGIFVNGKQKSIRDLPPLSDLPARKKADMTPPIVQSSNQAKDSKGLRTKEMEIELMNRKIAELEQRINAKKTTSRAQTPGTSNHTTMSSPPEGRSQDAKELSKATDGENEEGHTQQPSIAAAENSESIAVEQKLHEVELAKAEAERSLAADVAQASEEERTLQKETVSDVQAKEQSTLQEEQRQAQDSERSRLQEIERQEIEGEQQRRAQNEEPTQFREEDSKVREQDKRQLQDTETSRFQEEEQTRLLDDQRRERRIAIESGLPVLDATVEKTKHKLESLKKEIADLELEVQKGIKGRKALVDELTILSAAAEDPQDFLNVEENTEPSSIKEETQAMRVFSSPLRLANDSGSPRPQSPPRMRTFHDIAAIPQDLAHTSASSPTAGERQISDGEIEEDVMDISRSDVDEGEFSDYSPKLPNAEPPPQLIEDEETYEPLSDIGIRPQHEPEQTPRMVNSLLQDAPGTDSEMHNVADDVLATKSEDPSAIDGETLANIQDQEPLLIRSPSLTDASDPDDYEPPEPASLMQEAALVPKVTAPYSESSFMPSGADANSDIAPIHAGSPAGIDDHVATIGPEFQEGTAPNTSLKARRYTPYESPLKQFKSFRNHPEYLSEVSNGFRSLTYSHAINPEIPICRYELDGVCNDASCQSQHFKAIGLSDDRILVHLGAPPKDTDSTAFTNGLKQLVQDIRSRKIKDVNKVASEITAYRRRFLGGDDRVLSL